VRILKNIILPNSKGFSMFNKNIALVIAIIICNPAYASLGSHNYNDSHHIDTNKETNEKKLELLKNNYEKADEKENKLLLNENHWSNKQICFWLTLGSAGVAAASLFVKDGMKILGAAAIVGGVAAGTGSAAAYGQHCALHNITEEKKAIIKAINDVR
jgi:hypothetical protein